MKPKIRFKGFDGEWETSKLGDFSSSFSGGTPPVGISDYYGGDIPFIRSGEIHEKKTALFITLAGLKNSSAKIIDKGTLLYALYGATSGEVAISQLKGAINQAILAIFPNKMVDKRFLAHFLQSHKEKIVGELLQGGQGNLSGALVKGITVMCPKLSEQNAIADYIDSVDAQISASASRIASLKQIKAGSLQAMFPQEGETVPKVRFKGFKGEWDKVKLNTFAKRIMRKNSNLESTLALTIASAYGLVSQTDYFNNSLVGANLRNYYLLKKREFAYNKSYSNGYPFGSVKRLDRYEQGILSTLYIVFGIIDDTISSDYLTHFFDTTLWHKEVAERAAEGARNHGLLNIGAEDFLDINILKPQTKEEQQKIAVYFTSLDRQISLHSQRLEKLKQIKAACLDKMFV